MQMDGVIIGGRGLGRREPLLKGMPMEIKSVMSPGLDTLAQVTQQDG